MKEKNKNLKIVLVISFISLLVLSYQIGKDAAARERRIENHK